MNNAATLLQCESMAGRIEGILLADPGLAQLWRMEVALLEAAGSAGLEGERVSTPGMVLRLTGNLAVEEDSRAAEMALRILAVAKKPGDPFASPVQVIRRIESASAPVGQVPEPADRLEDAELPRVIEAARGWSQVPILAGWRAAANYAFRSRRQSPAAERLIFMAVEGASRHMRGFSPVGGRVQADDEGDASTLLMPSEAGWILAPSVALTRNGFRVWSPLSGLSTFLEGASRSLSHDLGHLGTLRHELSRLDAMAATAHGRSRLADLVGFLKQQPVVSSAMVVDALGLSRRTALSLIGELVEANCLANITARRAARFWALPSLASRMTPSQAPRRFQRVPSHEAEGPEASPRLEIEGQPGQLREQFDEDRLDRIMADLDAAMSGLDEVVRRAGGPRPLKD